MVYRWIIYLISFMINWWLVGCQVGCQDAAGTLHETNLWSCRRRCQMPRSYQSCERMGCVAGGASWAVAVCFKCVVACSGRITGKKSQLQGCNSPFSDTLWSAWHSFRLCFSRSSNFFPDFFPVSNPSWNRGLKAPVIIFSLMKSTCDICGQWIEKGSSLTHSLL